MEQIPRNQWYSSKAAELTEHCVREALTLRIIICQIPANIYCTITGLFVKEHNLMSSSGDGKGSDMLV